MRTDLIWHTSGKGNAYFKDCNETLGSQPLQRGNCNNNLQSQHSLNNQQKTQLWVMGFAIVL